MRVTVKSGILSLTRMLVTVTMLMMFSWPTRKVITSDRYTQARFKFSISNRLGHGAGEQDAGHAAGELGL